MPIVTVDELVRQQLIAANISPGIMDNCFNSKFLSVAYDGDRIMGVCFVTGILNNAGTEVSDEYRGRGISHALLAELVSECKKRNMHFLTGAFKPSNIASIRVHTRAGYVPVFTVHYNHDEGKEMATILPITGGGRLVRSALRLFDTRSGNALFAVLLWCSRPLMKALLGFSRDSAPIMNLSYGVKNFEKVRDTIKRHQLDIDL